MHGSGDVYAAPASAHDSSATRQSSKFGWKSLKGLGKSKTTTTEQRRDASEPYTSRTRELSRKKSNGMHLHVCASRAPEHWLATQHASTP